VRAGTADPTGCDLVANATPAGMTEGDPLPVEVAKLTPSTCCGCAVTKPEVSPFIEAARMMVCLTATGTEMYQA
jgi:shikimate dehydrogenase